jgi:hypothetical protein
MFIGLGALLMLIGIIWFIYLAVQTEQTTGAKVLWALLLFFLQPITGIIYFILRRVGLVPLILVLIGCIIYGYGAMSAANEVMRGLPR